MPKFSEKQFKTILNKKKFIDSWFWDRYSINPYNGCLFGCVYCDARSAKYHMPADFENNIVVKQNVGEMLDQRLTRARTLLPDVVGLGGVTDCYQGAEKIYENTRHCLKVLARHRYPIHLATKSTLVLRDLDLFEEIGRETWCAISVTITGLDPNVARFLDNRSPSPRRRLEVVREIKAKCRHVQTGVLLIPLVPYLADNDDDLAAMVAAVKEAGGDYLLFGGGMSLRNTQASWFLQHLQAYDAGIFAKYQRLYSFRTSEPYTGRHAPPANYLEPKQRLLLDLCQQHSLPYRIPRFIPDDFRRINYLVAEKLLNDAYKRQMTNGDWKNLFWAGQNIQNLAESLIEIAARNQLGNIRNVRGEVHQKVKRLMAAA